MESTQNKIYEIEESAFVDSNFKNVAAIDEDLAEENKNGKSGLSFLCIFSTESLFKVFQFA
jgi:hypothetical protein